MHRSLIRQLSIVDSLLSRSSIHSQSNVYDHFNSIVIHFDSIVIHFESARFLVIDHFKDVHELYTQSFAH